MLDNICSLPLRADVFTQAVHPTEPIFSVGLASGHVQTFRLPPVADTEHLAASQPTSKIHGLRISISKAPAVTERGRRLSENGFDIVDTAWQTRRHKGSCRALAFGADGSSLFSAGTDGLVKAAATETGRVTSKFIVPSITASIDAPSLVHALSPQSLLLGTDSGRLHLYDLRDSSSSTRPNQTFRPHVTEAEPSYAEPLTSLTALPPSSSSTSGTSRSWITTSGSTLAVCDLRKGVVKVSEDQGDVLLSSACVTGLGMSKRRRRMLDGEPVGAQGRVLVGGAGGVLTLWERGEWEDQSGRVVVHRGAGVDDDGTIDALAVVPEGVRLDGRSLASKVVVAGLGNGSVNFIRLRGGGGEVVGEVRHDETGVEGVATLGFDVVGRMISGGGQVIKLWHEKLASEDVGDGDDVESPEGAERENVGDDEDSDEEEQAEEESDSDSDEAPRKRKKRKKSRGKTKGGGHGITAFSGLD